MEELVIGKVQKTRYFCITIKTFIIVMRPSHIEHIGIAVKSLAESIPFFEKLLGIKCYAIEEVKNQRVKTAFFLIGQTKIELLESTDPEGPIGKFIEKKGTGIHHIAFAVENAGNALKEAEASGIQLIDVQSRKGAEGMNIGFLHPKSTQGILVEFCSK
jgi:methylmalonyl-CoA/ethylmalonyl-CoA epimerase